MTARPAYGLGQGQPANIDASRLARISHHLTVEARNRPAITSLRLLAVLNVLFKYASARQAAHALYRRASHALRFATW